MCPNHSWSLEVACKFTISDACFTKVCILCQLCGLMHDHHFATSRPYNCVTIVCDVFKSIRTKIIPKISDYIFYYFPFYLGEQYFSLIQRTLKLTSSSYCICITYIIKTMHLILMIACSDLSYNNFTWQGPEQPTCQQNMSESLFFYFFLLVLYPIQFMECIIVLF